MFDIYNLYILFDKNNTFFKNYKFLTAFKVQYMYLYFLCHIIFTLLNYNLHCSL